MNNFKLILPRPFLMGDNKVLTFISEPYEMQTTQVTQDQWTDIMDTNPSKFKGKQLPAEQVSFDDVQRFIKKINKSSKSYTYRLPTEAEWEYAAGCGLSTDYFFGNNKEELTKYAHFNSNETIKVGTKLPNYFGLYDMYGNVWEWIADWYDDTLVGGMNPRGPDDGSHRVIRGGSWGSAARSLRSAFRDSVSPGLRYAFVGFRLVRTKR